jgi:hypothetical protein
MSGFRWRQNALGAPPHRAAAAASPHCATFDARLVCAKRG